MVAVGRLKPAFPPRRVDVLSAPVFVAHRPQSHDVIVVFADGAAVRVQKP